MYKNGFSYIIAYLTHFSHVKGALLLANLRRPPFLGFCIVAFSASSNLPDQISLY